MLIDEIEDLKKKIYNKQIELYDMHYFFKIPFDDYKTLRKYRREIEILEEELDMKIKIYKKRKNIIVDLKYQYFINNNIN